MKDHTAALANGRILITRPAALAEPLIHALEQHGAQAEARPAIALLPCVEPAVVRKADLALADLPSFDWLLFSSANGVRFFNQRLSEIETGLSTLSGFEGRVGAIGPATARALEGVGRPADLIAEQSDGPGFAEALRGTVGNTVSLEQGKAGARGARVLCVRPEGSSSPVEATLSTLGAAVESIAVYRNVPAAGVRALAESVLQSRYALIVWTSPSALARLNGALAELSPKGPDVLKRIPAVAIGPTTAAALETAGIKPVAVAETPTDSGIVAAVLRARRVIPSRASAAGAKQEKPVSQSEPRKTAMHALHVEAGARMVDFAGWHMPVQYSGVLAEHTAVRTHAGLFDVSHMGEAMVRGPQALEFLQHVTCNDVSALSPGRAQYTGLTTPQGTFVDDLLVYMLGDNDYLLVLNAGNTPKDLAWLHKHAADFDVSIDDQSEAWSLLALQGPKAKEILEPLVPIELGKIKYYRFRQTQVDGIDCIVSRTGYTGEHGYELYAPADQSAAIWQKLCADGEPLGLQRVGLAARDTLRLEAKMALYGNDIDETTTVLEADLAWIVKLGKGDFIGRDALARQAEAGVSRKLIGFEMKGRGIARQGYPVHVGGQEVGQVTSGSFAPFLKKNIGLAYLPIEHSETGTAFEVMIRGRSEAAEVVPTPFYKRAR